MDPHRDGPVLKGSDLHPDIEILIGRSPARGCPIDRGEGRLGLFRGQADGEEVKILEVAAARDPNFTGQCGFGKRTSEVQIEVGPHVHIGCAHHEHFPAGEAELDGRFTSRLQEHLALPFEGATRDEGGQFFENESVFGKIGDEHDVLQRGREAILEAETLEAELAVALDLRGADRARDRRIEGNFAGDGLDPRHLSGEEAERTAVHLRARGDRLILHHPFARGPGRRMEGELRRNHEWLHIGVLIIARERKLFTPRIELHRELAGRHRLAFAGHGDPGEVERARQGRQGGRARERHVHREVAEDRCLFHGET